MEMDNHMSDKDESCYDNAEAAFSDDEEDLNSKGEAEAGEGEGVSPSEDPLAGAAPRWFVCHLCLCELVLFTGILADTPGAEPCTWHRSRRGKGEVVACLICSSGLGRVHITECAGRKCRLFREPSL